MNSGRHGSEREEILVACLGDGGQVQEVFTRWGPLRWVVDSIGWLKVRCQGEVSGRPQGCWHEHLHEDGKL